MNTKPSLPQRSTEREEGIIFEVGKGIEIPDNNFDGFEPVEPSTVEIIVSDLGDIEFVNWH